MEWLIFVGALACPGLVLAAVLSSRAAARREAARQVDLQAWANQHGWQWVRQPSVGWARRMPGRMERGVTLALYGKIAGRRVAIAEYTYTHTTPGSFDKSSRTSTGHFVLMMVWLRRPGPTTFVARRPGLGPRQRWGGITWKGVRLSGPGVTTIGFEPFDRAFQVSTADPRLLPSVLPPALIAAHVAGGLPDWSLEGNELLAYRLGRIGEPTGIHDHLAPLLRIADLIEPNTDQ